MNKFDCVIIDSGVNLSHPELVEKKISGIQISHDSSDRLVIKSAFQDQLGHGTAIYSIIRKNAPIHTKIFNIKIFDKQEVVDESLLIYALEYIARNIECKVVNISLGLKLCEDIKGLYCACKTLYDMGVLIIAAFDNGGAISYPAAFDCVIGVDATSDFYSAGDYTYVEGSPINILGKGGYQKVAWCYPEYAIVQGSSFTCAFVTANVLNILAYNSEYKYEEILDHIKNNAKKIITGAKKQTDIWGNYFEPSSVLLFPFNKEMHALVNFCRLLSFDIYSITDIRVSGNVNRRLKDILPFFNLGDLGDKLIDSIDAINWKASFDTVVVGHLEKLSKLTKRDLLLEILQLCVLFKKNIICFDDLTSYSDVCKKLAISGRKIYSPKSCYNNLPVNRFGKLYLINKPVVCVAGTSSYQGKFTLQLLLRETLIKRGYRVGQLGTEPSSLLFGMDEVFHYGYAIEDNPCYEQTVLYVNELMNRIVANNPDIIITGIQSGAVPYIYENICYLTNHQLEVLTGIMPDLVVLCINPYDDVSFIQRTILAIENYINTKVLCCVIYPMQYSEKFATFGKKEFIDVDEQNILIQALSSQLHIPIYTLDDVGAENIARDIVDYFSD